MSGTFSDQEKALMRQIKGVGDTVINRLEQIGIMDFKTLAQEDAETITKQIAQMLGSSCWGNSPQARNAIQSVIELAQKHQ